MRRASDSSVNSATATSPNVGNLRGKLGLLLALLVTLVALACWLHWGELRAYQLEKLSTPQLVALAQANPEDAIVTRIAGRRCVENGEFDSAKSFLPRAAQAHPEDISLQVLAGRLAWQSGDPQRGGTLLNNALQRAPFDVDAMYWTGEFLLDRGRKTEALSLLRDAARLEPSRGDILQRMAEVHIDSQEFSDALRELDAAEKVTPTATVARLRAAVLASLGRAPEAEAAARLAVEREPNAVGYRLLGEILQKGADEAHLRQAQGYLQRALQSDPHDSATLELLALNYRALGEHKAAVKTLRALLHEVPAQTQSYLLLSQSYGALGDKTRAAQVLRIFRQLQPLQDKVNRAKLDVSVARGTIASQLAYVRALLDLGRTDLASGVLESVWLKAPQNPQIRELARRCQEPPPIPPLPPDSAA